MRPLSLAVVGADHPNKRGPGRRFEIALCAPGEPVELRPEPNNPADRNAVAVYSCRGVQIGYVTAERAPWIGRLLGGGRVTAALFQHQAGFGAWVRVAFDGEQPTMPAMSDDPSTTHSETDHSGFWPDPVYDD